MTNAIITNSALIADLQGRLLLLFFSMLGSHNLSDVHIDSVSDKAIDKLNNQAIIRFTAQEYRNKRHPGAQRVGAIFNCYYAVTFACSSSHIQVYPINQVIVEHTQTIKE
jgi:hypothetical protein